MGSAKANLRDMRLFLALVPLISGFGLQKTDANEFLSRSRRGNSWHGIEEWSAGDLRKECFEEVCDQEENSEVFDDALLHDSSWAKLTSCREFLKLGPTQVKPALLDECYNNDDRVRLPPK